MDTIQGPFIYDAKPPQEIKFKALNQKEEHTAVELMEIYQVFVCLNKNVVLSTIQASNYSIYESDRYKDWLFYKATSLIVYFETLGDV